MAQDSNGYLWIGTQQGLYRYSNNRNIEAAFTEVDHPRVFNAKARQITYYLTAFGSLIKQLFSVTTKLMAAAFLKQLVSVTEDSETETLLTKLDDTSLILSYANKLYTYSVTTDQFSPIAPSKC